MKLQKLIPTKSRIFEGKISDITDAYISRQNELDQARKDYEEAQRRFNRLYAKGGKEGTALVIKFQKDIGKELSKRLNTNHQDGVIQGNSLIEIFIDNRKCKVSIHNRKYFSEPTNGVKWMIRDERSLNAIEGTFPEKYDHKQAADFIVKKIKEFERKYKTGYKWFK